MKYRKIAEALDRIVYLNGKQVISYWWTQETTGNSGTFGEHIHSPLWKDVSHPSPTSENNLISIVAI